MHIFYVRLTMLQHKKDLQRMNLNIHQFSITLNSILQNGEPGIRGAPYTRLLNVRGIPSNIAVAENGGFRVYRLSSTKSNREYYRCSRCDCKCL